ncbi:hypothetical protein RhiJN_00184 [Ceratobasidium sp. AG-Ba]|nr:hypothetical protein RhiJN_00184 [Ceratobasidium sp. AG-Ba]QRW01217.1 hypothetical protein RhiLY_00214 [Ceratobasidium sp. AG-Ba]
MDDAYECVPTCNYPIPLLTRKALSAHQRSCKKARAHEEYIASLSKVADSAGTSEPPAKRLCVEEPAVESDVVRAPSPGPKSTPSSDPVSHRPPSYPPPLPPRLTRAQARRLDTAFRSERDVVPEAPPPLPIPSSADAPSNASRGPTATTSAKSFFFHSIPQHTTW